MADRSNRAEVRNPILALPSAKRLSELSPLNRAALRGVLLDIRQDANDRAHECWRKHKAPMAAYWKAVAVYAGHIAKAVNRANIDQINHEGAGAANNRSGDIQR